MHYIDATEYQTIIKTMYSTAQMSGITMTNTADIETYITQAESFLDSLRFKGKYVEEYQEHAFPREINGRVYSNDLLELKQAICCIIYDSVKFDTNTRAQYIASGVKSVSIVGVSESYSDSIVKVTPEYRKYIKKFLFNGKI